MAFQIVGNLIAQQLAQNNWPFVRETAGHRHDSNYGKCFHFMTPLIALRWMLKNTFNTLRPRHKGRHFADDVFKCIFLNENVWISLKISLKFVPKGPINNIPSSVQIMAWRRPGDKPLSEPMMVSLVTHICVTRPQWVNDKSRLFQVLVQSAIT